MRNVTKYQLINCIFLTLDEFKSVLNKIYPDDKVSLEYDMDSLEILINDESHTEKLHNDLASYFDVSEVTSVHADDESPICIWIAYKK